MPKPNFFIIGAPKCGTTSLAGWIAEHRQVYFSPKKEPHFFSEERAAGQSVASYEQAFQPVESQHPAVGEGSTSYLASPHAVSNLMEYAPNARMIVCLRNPVRMFHSLHTQLVNEGLENETNVRAAWELQEQRRKGKRIPLACVGKPQRLFYGEQCLLGRHLQRLYNVVPGQQILPILLEDMQASPRTVYVQVEQFLGVTDDGRQEFPVLNSAARARSPKVAALFRFAAETKKRLGIRRSLGVASSVARVNVQPEQREPLPADFKAELAAYFRDDILLLQGLLGRDLSHWLADNESA